MLFVDVVVVVVPLLLLRHNKVSKSTSRLNRILVVYKLTSIYSIHWCLTSTTMLIVCKVTVFLSVESMNPNSHITLVFIQDKPIEFRWIEKKSEFEMLSCLIKKFYNDQAIKIQVLAALYSVHIHHGAQLHDDERIRQVYQKISANDDAYDTLTKESTGQLARLSGWEWQGIPKIHGSFLLLETCINLYYIYVVVKNLALVYIEEFLLEPLGMQPSLPLGCYFTGKFYASSNKLVDETMALVIALVQLIWRLIQYRHKQVMALHYFLLFGQKDLDTYYSRYVMGKYQGNHWVRSIRRAQKSRSVLEEALIECSFHDIMSYRPKSSHQIHYYRLRPNRTREVKQLLSRLFAALFLFSVIIMIVSAIPVVPFIFRQLISEQHYVDNFPECHVEMYWFRVDRDSFLPDVNFYRVYLIIADEFENTVIWIEVGTSILIGICLTIMLQVDLIIYWQDLHKNVLNVYKQLRDNPSRDATNEIDNPSATYRNSITNTKEIDSTSSNSVNQIGRNSRIDKEFDEIQHKCCDFFRQIKRADCFLSDALSFTLCMWFCIFLLYVYISNNGHAYSLLDTDSTTKTNRESNGSQLRTSPYNLMLLIIPMIDVFGVCFLLMMLHNRCLITYKYLCSLLAMHHSTHKLMFLPIMDYFVEHRNCYTLFRVKPFLPTTFLSILGWTFSCFFILRTLFSSNSGFNA